MPLATGRFVFVGESLALDLVNTEVVVRGKRHDLLASPLDAVAWWDAARIEHPEAALPSDHPLLEAEDDALLRALHDLRRAFRAVFGAVLDAYPIPDGELALLNRILGAGFIRVEFDTSRRPWLSAGVRDAGLDGLLFPIARSAAELLTGRDLNRLHRCGNERCVLLFYDTTKSATRRWCSTGCMDRARSLRRHRQRQRTEIPSPGWPGEGSG
jgi:predicted RNA-binding Zn ribbon-like protein